MPLRGPGTLEGIFAAYATELVDFTYSVDQSFSTDRFYRNLIINDNRTIATNGCALFVAGTLTIGDSVIIRPGVLGAGGDAAGAVGGAAGTNLSAGVHGGSWYSGGAGTIGNGANASTLSPSLGVHMGGGGGGGGGAGNGTIGSNSGGYGARNTADGGSGGAGAASPGLPGSAGTLLAVPENQVPASAATGFALSLYTLLTGHVTILGIDYPLYGGNGGGGGGGDGISEAGGGGGAGGGVVRIIARKIVRSGSGTAPIINANGGAGGRGQTPDGGGGGGGGGGLVMLGYGSMDASIVVTASGGASGTPGSNGGAGGAGSIGRIYRFQF